MRKHKQANGGTAVLERETRALTVEEALRFAYLVEDLLRAMKRRSPRDRRIATLLATAVQLREDLEDRSDVEAVREARKEPGSIPYETIRKELGL